MTTTIVFDASSVPEPPTPAVARPRQPRHSTVANAKLTFTGLMRSERIKLSSLRSVRMTLLVTLVAGLVLSTLIALLGSGELTGSGGAAELQSYLLTAGSIPVVFLALVFGVLGVLVMSSEYASGMIQSTLVAAPKRGAVFLAKALVLAGLAAATAVLVVGGGMLIAALLLPAALPQLWSLQILTAILGAAAYLTLIAVLAFGIATLTRNAAAAIGMIAGLIFVLPIAFSIMLSAGWAWVSEVMQWLPSNLGNVLAAGLSVTGMDVDGQLGFPGALIGMVVWAAIAVAPAAVVFVRRDAQ